MPIPVACRCGQKFRAKDELAGKAVKCPKCGQALRIPAAGQPAGAAQPAPRQPAPAPQQRVAQTSAAPGPLGPGSLDDLFDEVGLEKSTSGMLCMQCGKPMPVGGVLCVHCGYNHQTGERLARMSDDEDGMPVETYGNPLLDQAAKHIKYQEAESKKTNDLLPWWVYLIGLLVVCCFVAGMVMLPQSVAIAVSLGLFVACVGLVGFVGQVWILVVAFRDSVGQGIMVLLIPFYVFVYAWMHWDECGTPFYMVIGAFFGNMAISFLAPFVMPLLLEEEDPYGYLRQPQRPAYVAIVVPGEMV